MQGVKKMKKLEASAKSQEDGDVVQLVEHGTSTPLTQVRFPGAARDISPIVNF